jgi:uncharacterized damage-inducible protein DinB
VFTLDGIRKFHGWTHASLALLLDHLSALPTADYTEELPAFGFPTLRAQMIHICNCEGFWIHTLQGLSYADRKAQEYPAASAARGLLQDIGRQTHDYLSRLTDQSVNTEAELHFPDGEVALRTPALVLHHVLTHAFHHKGQVAAMCRALGHPAPDTDLNQFE